MNNSECDFDENSDACKNCGACTPDPKDLIDTITEEEEDDEE